MWETGLGEAPEESLWKEQSSKRLSVFSLLANSALSLVLLQPGWGEIIWTVWASLLIHICVVRTAAEYERSFCYVRGNYGCRTLVRRSPQSVTMG